MSFTPSGGATSLARATKIRHIGAVRAIMLTVLVLALAIGGCASGPPPEPIFDYTPAFRDETIVPLLKRTLGDSYRDYDSDTPLIATRPDGTVVLVFSFDYDKADCGEYIDPPYITIVVDPQTKAVKDVIAHDPNE